MGCTIIPPPGREMGDVFGRIELLKVTRDFHAFGYDLGRLLVGPCVIERMAVAVKPSGESTDILDWAEEIQLACQLRGGGKEFIRNPRTANTEE